MERASRAGTRRRATWKVEYAKRLPPDVIKALMGVDRSYVEGAFAGIRARSGNLDAYYKDELGLSATDIAALCARYLEKAR